MPTNKKLLLNVLLLSWLLLLSPCLTFAQPAHSITINHVGVASGSDSTGLDVFFTIRDENGRFIPQPNIKSATIELLGGNGDPVPVNIDKPQTTIFIALLFDTSGSMSNVMDQVRTAAKSAIDSAPSNAHFAVIPFNETTPTTVEFSDNHLRAKDAIDKLESITNQGTCLYDAVYETIGQLEDQITSPIERRAIILFTDGQDRLNVNDPAPCSRHTYPEVIDRAKAQGTITPIHTIGLYQQSINELNAGELRNMADETDAFSAIGNQADLSGLFQEIIDGLNSQLVARGNVLAQEGENQAVLSIQLSNDNVFLTAPFDFFSPVTNTQPTAPVIVQINSVRYDNNTSKYTLAVAINDAEPIHQLFVTVRDEANLEIGKVPPIDNPPNALVIELDAAFLQAEQEYVIRLQAVNIVGELFENEKGETVLAEYPFTHTLPEAKTPIKFTVQAVTADFANNVFYIDLDIPEGADRVTTYAGFILDGESGGKIHDFGPANFTGVRIQEPLPDAIRLAQITRNYPITLYLTTADGQRSEASYDKFEPPPPEPPSRWQRIVTTLQKNPLFLIPIGIVIVSLIGYFYLQNNKRKQDEPEIARPPVDKSIIISGSNRSPLFSEARVSSDELDFLREIKEEKKSARLPEVKPPNSTPHLEPVPPPPPPPVEKTAVRLRLQIIQRDAPPGPAKIISSFPCVIGRENCDLVIENDPRISRPHAQLLQHNNAIFVEDLNSRNGTFLDKTKLKPNTPTPLGQNTIIRLTSQTYLEVEQI